jgi:hypothetical protein
MKRFMNKKVATIGLAAGLALGGAGAAFAYFTSAGSGTGQASTGTSQTVTVVQDSIAYNGPASTSVFMPGDTATVAFGITNPGGNQEVGAIHLASWTSNSPSTCDSTVGSESGWFTMPDVNVSHDFGHGTDQTTGDTGTITFNDLGVQDACAGKTITFTYSSN